LGTWPEAITEIAIYRAFQIGGIGDLSDPVTDLSPSFNMGNDRIRKLYMRLTGDAIAGERCWSDFTKS
jgi:hypothetical protein